MTTLSNLQNPMVRFSHLLHEIVMFGVQTKDEQPGQIPASFSIEPLQQELPAKTACTFLIRGNFAVARILEERLRCIDSELREVFNFPVR